jgi:PAS domain S-box-containing protein
MLAPGNTPMSKQTRTLAEVLAENEELRDRLQEMTDTLEAIQNDQVDALVVTTATGDQVYTLKTAELPYRVFVEKMQEGAVTLLRDGTILYCNSRFAQIIRKPLEEVIGSSILDLFSADDGVAVMAVLQGQTGRGEFTLQAADGSTVPVFISASTTTVEEITNVCLVVTDLTEQKRSEAIVASERMAKMRAEAASSAKDHFLAVLSHELRAPLTPVLMAASALESDPDLSDSLREDMAMIKRSIELEVSLIDDLLDVNRIARGKLELRVQDVDAHVKIEAAIDVCRLDVQARALIVHTELRAEQCHVQGDASRLQQVFWNLLKNAIKFSPRGSQIEVHSSNPRPGVLRVEVVDNGIGIEPEALPRLFNAFEQGNSQVTRQFGGLGLGLAICKSLVGMHGGSIWAESAGLGQGARFILELPAIGTPVEAGAEAGFGPGGSAPRRALRVLVVEDHPASATVLTRLLERAGHTVKTVGAIQAALDLAKADTFDVLISDLGLPDGSGLDLIRQLQATHPKLPAIALSGYGTEADVQRSKGAGFAEHLTKPVEFGVLKEAVERLTAKA